MQDPEESENLIARLYTVLTSLTQFILVEFQFGIVVIVAIFLALLAFLFVLFQVFLR